MSYRLDRKQFKSAPDKVKSMRELMERFIEFDEIYGNYEPLPLNAPEEAKSRICDLEGQIRSIRQPLDEIDKEIQNLLLKLTSLTGISDDEKRRIREDIIRNQEAHHVKVDEKISRLRAEIEELEHSGEISTNHYMQLAEKDVLCLVNALRKDVPPELLFSLVQALESLHIRILYLDKNYSSLCTYGVVSFQLNPKTEELLSKEYGKILRDGQICLPLIEGQEGSGALILFSETKFFETMWYSFQTLCLVRLTLQQKRPHRMFVTDEVGASEMFLSGIPVQQRDVVEILSVNDMSDKIKGLPVLIREIQNKLIDNGVSSIAEYNLRYPDTPIPYRSYVLWKMDDLASASWYKVIREWADSLAVCGIQLLIAWFFQEEMTQEIRQEAQKMMEQFNSIQCVGGGKFADLRHDERHIYSIDDYRTIIS